MTKQEEMRKDCNFQCLSNCPLPIGSDCLYDDPDLLAFDLVEYPKFYFWRDEHGVRPLEDWTVNDPNPMMPRCPRCHSTKVGSGYMFPNYSVMQCHQCGYNKPLIDFPSAKY